MRKAISFLLEAFKKLLTPKPLAGNRGKWGEEKAVTFLKRKGYRIIAQNVRFGHREEIDIVAVYKDTLVFVEVKTRSSEKFGAPLNAVDRRKRHFLARAAVRFLKQLRQPIPNFRFDVIEVIGSQDASEVAVIRHTENVFPLDRRYFVPYK